MGINWSENDCSKCPAYWWEQGWEDCDEGCRISDRRFFNGCNLWLPIRYLLFWYYKWQENRSWARYIRDYERGLIDENDDEAPTS